MNLRHEPHHSHLHPIKEPAMTRRIIDALRSRITAPAWAVHFHDDAVSGESVACFDERCQRPPLSTDHRLGA
jgi:hypothetical protein